MRRAAIIVLVGFVVIGVHAQLTEHTKTNASMPRFGPRAVAPRTPQPRIVAVYSGIVRYETDEGYAAEKRAVIVRDNTTGREYLAICGTLNTGCGVTLLAKSE